MSTTWTLRGRRPPSLFTKRLLGTRLEVGPREPQVPFLPSCSFRLPAGLCRHPQAHREDTSPAGFPHLRCPGHFGARSSFSMGRPVRRGVRSAVSLASSHQIPGPSLAPSQDVHIVSRHCHYPLGAEMAQVENTTLEDTRANGLAVMREHAASDIYWRGGCVADGPGVSCEQEGFTGVLSLGSTWGSPGEIKELTLERPPARLMWLVWVPPGQQGDIEAPWGP